MGIPVRLDAFEGPLDLLLHLIDKNKVNIYDIPIARITDQYMEYLQEMKQRDLNVMSEFLVMAATLLDIKSKMLLPKEKDEEGNEEDPRQELVQQLLEYKMYKYMSYELRERQQDADFILYHEPAMPKEVLAWRQPVQIEELLDGVTLARMHGIFKDIMRRQADRVDPVRSTFGTLEKEEVDMDLTREWAERYLAEHPSCSFREMLSENRTRMQIIIVFLILLELMKEGKIRISQAEIFGELTIQVRRDGQDGQNGEDSEDERTGSGD